MIQNHTPTPHQNLSKAYQDVLLAGTAKSPRRAYQRDVKYFWAWAKLSLNLSESYPVTLEQTIGLPLTPSTPNNIQNG